jgi:hypothetical protein
MLNLTATTNIERINNKKKKFISPDGGVRTNTQNTGHIKEENDVFPSA